MNNACGLVSVLLSAKANRDTGQALLEFNRAAPNHVGSLEIEMFELSAADKVHEGGSADIADVPQYQLFQLLQLLELHHGIVGDRRVVAQV